MFIANIWEVSHGYLADKENNEESENDENSDNKEYNDLKIENNRKDKKIKELENEYFEKISELLVMIQVHCEIKTDMFMKFKEAGVITEK